MTRTPLDQYYSSLDAGDFDGAAAAFAPEAIYVRPASGAADGPSLEVFRGRDAILDWFERRGRRSFHHEVRSCVVQGDRCFVEGVVVGGDQPGRAFLASATIGPGGLITRYVAISASVSPSGLEILEGTHG